jgi:hypothetical protein
LAVLSHIPTISECAVGINADGPEWEQLVKFVTHFGTDRIIGVDYKNYDNSLYVEILEKAMHVFNCVARMSGNYSEDDFKIMRGLTTDLLFPYVALNGTLVGLTGTNPSGNNLTAYLNSVCNSLLFRVSYFTTLGTHAEVPRFRDRVKLMTYGDDAIGSVSSECAFNMVHHQNVCQLSGIVVTMSDKSPTMKPYVCFVDTDFLKRTSRYCPDRGVIVSLLSLSSIFKMLHVAREGGVLSDDEQCVENICTAARYIAFYERGVYDEFVGKLQLIATSFGWVIPELNKNYDQHVREWKLRYEFPDDISSLSTEVTTISLSDAGGQYDDWDGDSPNEFGSI